MSDSGGSGGIAPSQETTSLLAKAHSLINEEFRVLKNVSNQDRFRTPKNSKPSSVTSAKSSVGKSAAESAKSVRDARQKLKKEWEALKNRSELDDGSLEEKVKELRRREAAKEILAGVAAYVEIPNKKQIERMKFLLSSMGATIYENFSREVTHIIYKNGSMATYKRAKLLNVHLVSVLWVEACKNSKSRVLEKLFPVFDKNEYSTSPRVFRKFMEYQSKHFVYDENAGTIVRKTQKDPSLLSKMNQLAIGDPKRTNQKLPDNANDKSTSAGPESSTSNASLRLESSPSDGDVANRTDDASVNNKSPLKRSFDNGIPQDAHSTNVEENQCHIDVESHGKSSKTSPVKRRLFSKHLLHASFLKISQDENSQNDPLKKIERRNLYGDETNKKQPVLATKNNPPSKQNARTGRDFIRPATFQRKSPQKCSDKGKLPCLVTSYLHTHENIYVKNVLSELGRFKFKANVDANTTHVVVGAPKRTVNILKGIARGCWIVHKDWVEESAGAGRWLAEDRFELISFSNVVRRARTERQAFGKDFGMDIFDECGLIYIGKDCEPPCRDLCELVKLCGGKLTTNCHSANVVVGDVIESKMCVSEAWILDSIMYGRYKSLSKYVI